MEPFLIFGGIGRLVVWILQKSPYRDLFNLIGTESLRRFLQKLFDCDLCLGVWVYSILAPIMKINMYHFYVPVVSEILTGISMSFLVWLLVTGFKDRFFIIYVE